MPESLCSLFPYCCSTEGSIPTYFLILACLLLLALHVVNFNLSQTSQKSENFVIWHDIGSTCCACGWPSVSRALRVR